MIDRRELLDAATRMSLLPHVVEKDYVLGWMLAGINAHTAIRDTWIFKGGTCLKKCFFETYRFSEDLDFTLTDPSHIDEKFLKRVFAEIGQWIYENTGIEVPSGQQDFDIYTNPRGALSCQGKISYRGPISSPSLPRIKLDLTADERLVLPPVKARVFHPYSDSPDEEIEALAYAYEELFAEKVRALAERTRPRDLYDVVNLFRNVEARPVAAVMLDVLRQKCTFKGISVPSLADLEPHREDLAKLWDSMLGHQLPSLPPYEAFWRELPSFFDWLAGGVAPVVPAAYIAAPGEFVLRERVLRLPLSGTAQSFIEVIRFAAANRLLVELDYDRSTRKIEPYSLRRTQDGHIILHAHNVDKNEHRSYRADRIVGARVTRQSFVPRHQIELAPQGPVLVGPATSRIGSKVSGSSISGARQSSRARAVRATGLVYVYQCPYCQKSFRRNRMDSHLNPHKNKAGGRCAGRTGYLITTR